MHFQRDRFGPKETPKLIKTFIFLLVAFSVLAATVPNNYLYNLLAISKSGIKSLFLWQFITNLFLIPNQAISFGFVFQLLFSVYILWIFGCTIFESYGKKKFLSLFFISGIISSTVAILISPRIFAGGNIFLHALAISWLMTHGDAKLFFLPTLPIKAIWIILGIITLNLLSLLSDSHFNYFFAYLTSMAISYLFSLLILKRKSPFKFLSKFETAVLHLLKKKKF